MTALVTDVYNIEMHPIPGTLSWVQVDMVTTVEGNVTTYTYATFRSPDGAAGIPEIYVSGLPSRDAARTVASLAHRDALCRSAHN